MDQGRNDYEEVKEWTETQPSDTTPPEDYRTVPKRRHTLPHKPIPPPRVKVDRFPSTDNASPATQRKGSLSMPLSRNEGTKPLPSLPTSTETKLPISDSVLEEPIRVANIISKPYSLESFYKEFELPQFVSVVGGHLGVSEEYSMSEGEELVLFFAKSSQVVVASSEQKSEWYYIPLNSSLQFVPCQYLPTDDDSVKGEDYFQQYNTVADLLNKKGGLPKVVKVCNTYNGKSAQSSVMAGELIFPQKVSVTFTRKKVLECLNTKNKLLKLEPNCKGNFSINPADVKLHLVELVHYFQDFPISVMVINDHVGRSKSSSLSTGTILSLDKPKEIQSFICSTDVDGKMNFPLMELPMTMPIKIQCIEYPESDMKPIYSKIQYTYENFKPSLIGKNMFNAKSTSMLATQQALYEEIQHDNSTEVYNLQEPTLIYDTVCTQFNHSEDVVDQNFHPAPVVEPMSSVDTRPPLPPPRNSLVDTGSPLIPPRHNPPAAVKKKSDRSVADSLSIPPKLSTESTDIRTNGVTCDVPTVSLNAASSSGSNEGPKPCAPPREDVPTTVENPAHISSHNPTPSTSTTKNTVLQSHSVGGTTKEENIEYIKALSLVNILQLLENMNLGQYKASFEGEQIDGEMFIHLERADLVDLGVNKNIHQTRLLKLIDGTVSIKKYEDGNYALMSKQSVS